MGDGRPGPVFAGAVALGVSTKLYLDIPTTVAWARVVATIARTHPAVRSGAVRLFVAPSLPAIPAVRNALLGTPVLIGAQNLHGDDRGAFTGEVSGADLAAIGCDFVEIGHAERRRFFGEDDTVVAAKVAAALRNGLVPLICIGEVEQGDSEAAVRECVDQLVGVLADVPTDAAAEVVIAYEPVWAIGRSEPASAAHIRAVVAGIEAHLAADERVAQSSVIYGGSAKRGVLTDLGGDVDGLFLGRFAHDPVEFGRIIDEAALIG